MSDLRNRLRSERMRLFLDKARELRLERGARPVASGRLNLREARLERELRLAKERITTLSRLAYLDRLCRVPNRRAFNDELVRTRKQIRAARRAGRARAARRRPIQVGQRHAWPCHGRCRSQCDRADHRNKPEGLRFSGKIGDLQIMAPTGALMVTWSAGGSLIKAIAGQDVVVQADQAIFQRKWQGQAGTMRRADVTGRS